MEEKNNIGNRIKFLRESEGYTQKELATKLGLKGETAVANYEAGYSTPKDDIKFKMCEIFNCSLDYLMCKSDIRNPEEIKKVPFANAGGLDTKGLDDEDIEELQRQIDYIKKMKGKNNGTN